MSAARLQTAADLDATAREIKALPTVEKLRLAADLIDLEQDAGLAMRVGQMAVDEIRTRIDKARGRS